MQNSSTPTFTPRSRTGRVIQPGSLDMLRWSDDWLALNRQADAVDDDAAEALGDDRDEYEDAILAAPCTSPAAALAKVRVLVHHTAPGSPFEDLLYHRVLTQLVGWLETHPA